MYYLFKVKVCSRYLINNNLALGLLTSPPPQKKDIKAKGRTATQPQFFLTIKDCSVVSLRKPQKKVLFLVDSPLSPKETDFDTFFFTIFGPKEQYF